MKSLWFLPVTGQKLREYVNDRGERLMGLVVPFREHEWGLFIAENYEKAFSGLIHARHRNIIILCCFSVFMGTVAYLLTGRSWCRCRL